MSADKYPSIFSRQIEAIVYINWILIRCCNIIAYFLSNSRDGNFSIGNRVLFIFFLKLTFYMNKIVKTWGRSLYLPCANEAEC